MTTFGMKMQVLACSEKFQETGATRDAKGEWQHHYKSLGWFVTLLPGNISIHIGPIDPGEAFHQGQYVTLTLTPSKGGNHG